MFSHFRTLSLSRTMYRPLAALLTISAIGLTGCGPELPASGTSDDTIFELSAPYHAESTSKTLVFEVPDLEYPTPGRIFVPDFPTVVDTPSLEERHLEFEHLPIFEGIIEREEIERVIPGSDETETRCPNANQWHEYVHQTCRAVDARFEALVGPESCAYGLSRTGFECVYEDDSVGTYQADVIEPETCATVAELKDAARDECGDQALVNLTAVDRCDDGGFTGAIFTCETTEVEEAESERVDIYQIPDFVLDSIDIPTPDDILVEGIEIHAAEVFGGDDDAAEEDESAADIAHLECRRLDTVACRDRTVECCWDAKAAASHCPSACDDLGGPIGYED